MKIKDVIEQLQIRLPLQTDYFNDSIAIVSASVLDSVITFQTETEHELSIGDSVVISDIENSLSIDGYSIADGIATLTFAADHGYNFDANYEQTVEITGSDDADGVYSLVAVENGYSLSIEFSGDAISGAASIVLTEGFNGGYEVADIVDDYSFTVPARTDIFSKPNVAISDGTMSARIRIAGVADMERFNAVYTKQNTNECWLVVTPAQNRSSRDRDVLTDAISGTTQAGLGVAQVSIKQAHLETIEIYAVIPASEEIAGRLAADMAEEIRWFIYKSLVCAPIATLATDGDVYALMPVSDGYFAYLSDNTTYVHRYVFERVVYMSGLDVAQPMDQTAPYRGLDLSVSPCDMESS